MKITSFGLTLEEHTLQALEQAWKCKLPKGYREFLLQYNGGTVSPNTFFFKNDPNDGSDARYLYGILPEKYYNLLDQLQSCWGRIPKNMLPISEDSGGNFILLAISGQDYGKVYFWDHEREAGPGEAPSYDNLTLIADSFDEFLNNLFEVKFEDDPIEK